MSIKQADEEEYHVSARGPIHVRDVVEDVIQSRKIRGLKCSRTDFIVEAVTNYGKAELRKFPLSKEKKPRHTPARHAQNGLS